MYFRKRVKKCHHFDLTESCAFHSSVNIAKWPVMNQFLQYGLARDGTRKGRINSHIHIWHLKPSTRLQSIEGLTNDPLNFERFTGATKSSYMYKVESKDHEQTEQSAHQRSLHRKGRVFAWAGHLHELLTERPFTVEIVNLKFAIRWNVLRLDGTQVLRCDARCGQRILRCLAM